MALSSQPRGQGAAPPPSPNTLAPAGNPAGASSLFAGLRGQGATPGTVDAGDAAGCPNPLAEQRGTASSETRAVPVPARTVVVSRPGAPRGGLHAARSPRTAAASDTRQRGNKYILVDIILIARYSQDAGPLTKARGRTLVAPAGRCAPRAGRRTEGDGNIFKKRRRKGGGLTGKGRQKRDVERAFWMS